MAFTPMAWAQFSGGTTYLENCLFDGKMRGCWDERPSRTTKWGARQPSFDGPLLHPDRGIESRKTMIANRN